MSISVNNITKIYGTQKALDSVTLEVKPGEIIGLLGPNGAGKSTLMKILTCFIPPTSGVATVCGFDVLDQSIEVRRKVGYLPENNPLYLDLYVREFLEFIAGTHGLKVNVQKRVAEMVGLTGLTSEQHKKLGALSKGYRQRVGLAQALIHDPEVLILDEPTSGLDPNQLSEIRGLISEIGKQKTILMSTHIMQEVEAICNRVVIIHKGRIAADDSTQAVHRLTASKVLIRVEFNTQVSSALLRGIPGVTAVSVPGDRSANHSATRGDQRPGGSRGKPGNHQKTNAISEAAVWLLESEPGKDIRADVFRFAVEKGLTVLSLQQEEHTLEEVFQELTRV